MKHQGDDAVVPLRSSVKNFFLSVTHSFGCQMHLWTPTNHPDQKGLTERNLMWDFVLSQKKKTFLSPYWFPFAASLFLIIFTFSLVFYFHHLKQLSKTQRTATLHHRKVHTYTDAQPHRAGFVTAPLPPHFFSKGIFNLTWRCVWWLTPCWAATRVSSPRLAAIFRGLCMTLAQLIRRGGDMSSATRKIGCKEGINIPYSLTNYISSWKKSPAFLRFFKWISYCSPYMDSSHLSASSPFCLLWELFCYFLTVRFLTNISSAPAHAPLALWLILSLSLLSLLLFPVFFIPLAEF